MKVSTEIDNNFGYKNITQLADNIPLLSIGYSTIETKEAARTGYNGFLFPHEYSGEGRGA
jgi:hypothetical protein